VTAVNLWKIPFNPAYSTGATTTLSGTSAWIDASDEKEGYIFRMPEAMTITHVGVRFISYSGTPPTYRISLQGVSTANGDPDGAVLGGGACFATFTPPGDASWNNVFQWFQLGSSYAAARGELIAVVMDYSSGTINGANRSQILEYWSGQMDDVSLCPYADNYVSSWTKRNMTCCFGIKAGESPTLVYGRPNCATTGGTTLSVNGYRAALKFTLPSWLCSTAQIAGMRVVMLGEGAAGSCKFGLWNAGGVLQDITLDADLLVNPASTYQLVEVYFDEVNLSSLAAGTTYYLGVERVAASTAVYGISVTTASDLLAYPMGDGWILSTWDGAAWSDTTTTRPYISPIFVDITAPAGGGGMIVHPGMVGGLRG
jgi:hypothetical protein